MATTNTRPHSSALEPLKVPQFRAIWIAAIITNTGFFVQDVGASWLMTSLTTQPIMTALMQTAATLPFFLLGLPAGALADVVNRRNLILGLQFWMLLSAATLAFVTINGLTNEWVLLALTFLLFVGTAFGAPAWSATTPDLVPKAHLESAIGLGSAGFNSARGLGAAIGGLIVASFGPGWAFAINACCYTFMIHALLAWKYMPTKTQSPSRITGAIKSGILFVQESRAMKAILARTVFFAFAVSVMFSLLPLLAREQLRLNSIQYGILISAFGVGTCIGAVMLPRMRRHRSLDYLSSSATMMFVVSLTLLALTDQFLIGLVAMLIAGIGWTIKNSSLNVAVQFSAPHTLRARAFSIYLLTFQGCTAFGALFWGTIATWLGMPSAFLVAAVALCLGLCGSIWFKLSHAEDIDRADLATSAEFPAPVVAAKDA